MAGNGELVLEQQGLCLLILQWEKGNTGLSQPEEDVCGDL